MSNRIGLGIIGKNFGYNVIYKSFIKNSNFKVLGFSCKTKNFNKINLPKDIKLYYDWKKLILDKKIKAIVIASPPSLHKKIINFALKNNKHIFCEKPFTCSKKEASYICKLIKNKKSLSNMVNYEFVEIDAFRYFRKHILNKVKIDKIDLKWFLDPKQKNNTWKENHSKGGGLMFNYVCHAIYYLESFFGEIISTDSKIFFSKGKKIKSLNSLVIFKSGLSARILIKILPKKLKKNSIHQIKITSKKYFYLLNSRAKNLNDRFEVLRINKSLKKKTHRKTKSLFTSKESDNDFRIQPIFKNSKKFSSWILKRKKQEPNFLNGQRVHCIIDKMMHFSKEKKKIYIN